MLSHLAAVGAVLVLVAACGGPGQSPDPPPPSADPVDVEGAWELLTGSSGGADLPLVADRPITLTITGSVIGGSAACNTYGGRLTVAGGRLQITDLGMTAMGCEEPVMAAEAAYMAALGRVEDLRLEGEDLVLEGPETRLRFGRLPEPPTAELVDTVWVLDTLFVGDIASAPAGDRATLELRSDGTFIGSTGCRSFSGNWVEAGEQIDAPIFGMDQTECREELMDQDSHVVSVIGDGFVPTLDGDVLTLSDPGGIGLVYRAESAE